MKTLFALLLSVLTSVLTCSAETINPSCFSNATDWRITKIESTYDGTYVYLDYYSYKQANEFWISSGTYIENYNDPRSTKYYIKSFVGNSLDNKYTLDRYTTYNFILKFEKIPNYWTDINILEPPVQGATSWYWKYISLNKPETERLRVDNFIKNHALGFFEAFAHPTNTYKRCRYNVDYNSTRLTLYYDECYTDLEIKFSGGLVTSINVVGDSDFIPPFSVLSLIKEFVLSQNNDEQLNALEKYLRKTVSQMNGCELACAALTVLYNAN